MKVKPALDANMSSAGVGNVSETSNAQHSDGLVAVNQSSQQIVDQHVNEGQVATALLTDQLKMERNEIS